MASFSGVQQLNDGNQQLVDSTGTPLDVVAGNLQIDVTNEVEIKNDAGNPISVTGSVSTSPSQLDPLGFQQLTVTNVAVGLTVPVGADVALIQNDSGGNDVRWRDDGVPPTASIGMELLKGVTFEYNGDLSAIDFIRKGGGNGTLNISYYAYI